MATLGYRWVPMSAVDLYCGAGGWSEGLRQAGIKVVLGVDIWKTAIESYTRNGFNGYLGDCLSIIPDAKVDVIVGSPECKQYSTANPYVREVDTTQVRRFFQIVKQRKPRFWVMENVIPALKHIRDLIPRPYVVQKIDCADYGVPQHRRRLFVSNFRFTLNKQEHVPLKSVLPSVKSFWNKHFDDKNGPAFYPSDRPATTLIAMNAQAMMVSESCQLAEPAYYQKENVKRWMVQHPRLHPDKPSNTITAHAGRDRRNLIHPEEWRTLTPEECALIQGFPPNYIFVGAKTTKFIQIGNAVPPPIAKQIGEVMLTKLR